MRDNTSRYNTRHIRNILEVPKTILTIRELKISFPKLSQSTNHFAFCTVIATFAVKLRTTEVEGKFFVTI